MTFNIQHGAGGDAAALGRACAGLQADVLALQEVDVRVPRSRFVDEVAVVARATGMHSVFAQTCRVGGVGRYGNALLTRAPMADVEVVRLPRVGRTERRGAVLASVDGVTVAATHLSIHQGESAAQLTALVELVRERPQPWVLLGDLNRFPDQLDALAGFDLADTAEPTFPADAPRARIDHIAVVGLRIESVEVLPRQPVSDHRPLAATLISQ
ncbi:MAG TPA: endonuclease/exonuclease/phosphatase family protein [Acidimicrobiales bacterium]|nr:endonuclease/exonuclease/phosphatase family protein [Acidimicrobiales bacterium]